MSDNIKGYRIKEVADSLRQDGKGLEQDDLILRVNGRSVTDEASFNKELLKAPNDTPIICVLRENKEVHIQLQRPGSSVVESVQGYENQSTRSHNNFDLPRATIAKNLSNASEAMGWLSSGLGVVLLMAGLMNTSISFQIIIMPSSFLIIGGFFLVLSSIIGRAIIEMASSALRSEKMLSEIYSNQREQGSERTNPASPAFKE